ncbi:50S ribosomal protein L23 [Candidatus Roizmanbacteria bacterium RIFCSPHIGHO2_12_FULL_41_11]|uniref:Large ribosomal subunit protein uL23 n=3 Tax=Candidatus Roizmaniibacteriota TaxID=1752723 RepID=A0A1F7JQ09_9BACT|nr:MAG: 50S ribosomal protein L23 [Candidatus Roizmanbacteria bacterium RIFCSPHIGHO2_12_FULL_41_11]OGK51321.1 MAG: 50S ribosomal protein L23 [Candidatus Roizmanbacteria bacterium RIFCSPLOWO2_01_FULL_41_22]OGK57697.1 MAG: 50S ribosomal protein L23 [Candidatus Roizmanbacteria bacterium RIFCSPLOWO2_02_FULL_41_9]
MQINTILISPVLTEKATQMAQNNVYAFTVAARANKNQIAAAVELLYKVKVAEVKITIRKGKIKKAGKRMYPVPQANRKIAYISVKEGTINLFPKA